MRTLLILFFLVLPLGAQTRAELDSKYGAPEGNRYRIKPGVAVEVTFSENGKAKTFRIIPDDPNGLLKIEDVRTIIRELVPGRICHSPRSYMKIDADCPPRKSCQGVKEVWETVTTLMVSNKDGVAYNEITLNDKIFPPPGNIKLLPGYEHLHGCGIDSDAGFIEKIGGIKIHYDIGVMAGNDARREINSGNAEWAKTEQANGDTVLILLTKAKYIVATFEKANANFVAVVGPQSNIDDFLKMVLTYDPHH